MKLVPIAAMLFGATLAMPAIAHAQTEAATAAFTIDTPIETLMGNDATKAIVVKHLGAMDQHPAYGQFKTMSLVQLKPWSQGAITDEILDKIKADLAAL